MASSGYFHTNGYSVSDGNRYLTFSWVLDESNVANNFSEIAWDLVGGGNSKQYIYAGNFKVVINGETVYSYTGDRIKLYNGTVVKSGKTIINHKEDGTGSFSVSIEAGIYTYAVNCKGSRDYTLPTIARASQPSCITYPNHTQNVGYFGDTISIHMNRQSSSFTHTVTYKFGSKTGTIATNVGTGVSWTIPNSLMDLIPSATSGSGTIYVDTYNGSTKIGTKSCGFTASVPASVKPSCKLTLEDVAGIDKIYGSPVKGLSKIKITVTPTVAYSSPIASYSISANGATYSTATATTGYLNGTEKITATVKDKRGRSGSASYTMTILDYNAPTISALSVYRCNEDGTKNDRGNYVSVHFSASISQMDGKNTASYKLQYKKTSASTYTTITLSEIANNFSLEDYEYIFAADGDSSYDVVFEAQDKHQTVKRSTSASTAFTLVNYWDSGDSLTFGGVSEERNTFQNNLNFVQRGNQYCYSSIGAASTDGYILMARITVTATNSDSPITFVFSRRKAVAPMTVHILFNSTGDTDPGLASIRYEGDNYDAYLTSPSPSVWDLYVKKANNSDTITLNRWHTSYRQMKRINVEFVGSIVSTVPTGRHGFYKATPAALRGLIDFFLPVGMIIHLYSHADPNTMYPGTTWERIENSLLWATTPGGVIGWVSAKAAKTTSDGYAFTQVSVWRRTA